MPRNIIGPVPFPPLDVLDTDEVVTQEQLGDRLRSRLSGLSLCVRSATGHANRGGYFFHVRPKDESLREFDIYNMEQTHVHRLTLDKLTALINHCAGFAFSEDSFQLCQSLINFKLDPKPKLVSEES